MSKLKLLLLICVLLISSYHFSTDVRNAILGVNDFIINKTYDAYTNITNSVKKYFNQVEQIQDLRIENEILKKYEILYNNLLIDYDELSKAHHLNKYNFNLSMARVLTYEKMGDLNKFWLSYSNLKPNKIYGLVYDNNAVGIMYENDNRAYALSIYDEKSAISVRIGSKNIPAIVQGAKNAVYANFIIDYEKVNIGDEVYTSGKDLIFIDGIYIGKIAKIIDEAGYKRALLSDTKTLYPYKYVYVVSNE